MTHLFVDIETLPDLRDGAKDRARAILKAPANYSKPETIEKWKDENAEESWRKTGLDGGYGSICVIGFAIDKDPVVTIINEADEHNLLTNFHAALQVEANRRNIVWSQWEWIGHNVIGFDLPFLWKRCVVNNLPHNFPKDSRHGSGRVYDTMQAWSGWKDRISLRQLADILGFAHHKDDMDGSQVYDTWAAGDHAKVADYCAKDVELTRQIFKRLT
jgi:hypothetical protein